MIIYINNLTSLPK